MKFVNWFGLAAGIFLGGIFAYLITRFLSLDLVEGLLMKTL